MTRYFNEYLAGVTEKYLKKKTKFTENVFVIFTKKKNWPTIIQCDRADRNN